MNLGAVVGNTAWLLASLAEYRRFVSSLGKVEATQRAVLAALLQRNADTRFGIRHGFAGLRSWEDYSEAVPSRDYDGFRPWVDAIRAGDRNVLTADAVSLLEPTSGSTGAEKLIPYTASLQREIRRAVAAWTSRLFIGDAALLGGRAYWSLTPQLPNENRSDSAVPIGFDEDGAYLGQVARRLLGLTMVTQPGLKRLRDMDEFWFWSNLLLLGCADLRLISVWHPSYLVLLLEHMESRWDELLEAVGNGLRRDDVGLRFAAAPARARQLEQVDRDSLHFVWRNLRLISCWGGAHAAQSVADVERRFPGVVVQEKGLVATEGIVTIPFGDHHPLALRSHFYEFEDDDGNIRPAWDLSQRQGYNVLLTTGGGLYRYQLRDRVEVTGFLGETPSLRFVGKADRVSDLFGEKLSEVFVATVLRDLLRQAGNGQAFALLAPHASGSTARYELYLAWDAPQRDVLETSLERALCNNPHYRLCRDLGQLGKVVVVPVGADAHALCLERLRSQGRRLGDIKPLVLSDEGGWRATFGVD